MKTHKALAGILVAGLLACPVMAADSAGTVVKDSAVTVAIKTKLAAENVRSLANIHVDTDSNGVVSLKGTVDSKAEADRAVEIARTTDKVRSVHSELVVKP
ncbi:MAG: BON domain-containing protein [Steroidobacteraceae bacterium]